MLLVTEAMKHTRDQVMEKETANGLFTNGRSSDLSSSAAVLAASNDDTPPKITSALGNVGKCVIKPIAFKPLSRRLTDKGGQHFGSTPVLARSASHIAHYGSSNDLHRQVSSSILKSERKLRSVSPVAMSSLPFTVNHKLRTGYESMDNIRKTPPAYSSKNYSPLCKSSCRTTEGTTASEESGSLLDLTPSPCESNPFAEMEAALRERDYELSYLRQTMEHNEQVIFKVYQEKEHAYERELRKLKALHENRLRAAAQKSLKLEQMLMMQTYQLQEEKKRLRKENLEASSEISALRDEINALRTRLEETEWDLCQKTGELAHIKSQLKDTQGEQSSRGQEVVLLRKEVNQLRADLEDKEAVLADLRDQVTHIDGKDSITNLELMALLDEINIQVNGIDEKYSSTVMSSDADNTNENTSTNILDKLRLKINFIINQWKTERLSWEKERNTWSNEKQKVLCYQKQLQLSYIEMFRRNRALETELGNLTLELNLNGRENHKKRLQAPKAIEL